MAELLDPVGFSVKLLEGMIKFWKRFAPFIESSGNFSDKEIPKLQEKLLRVEKYMDKLYACEPKFGQDDHPLETEKQVFFLNLFNALVLYNLALQMVSNIETVTKLNCFNMWQAFLTQCYVRISMHKINAFTILRGFLRNSLPVP